VAAIALTFDGAPLPATDDDEDPLDELPEEDDPPEYGPSAPPKDDPDAPPVAGGVLAEDAAEPEPDEKMLPEAKLEIAVWSMPNTIAPPIRPAARPIDAVRLRRIRRGAAGAGGSGGSVRSIASSSSLIRRGVRTASDQPVPVPGTTFVPVTSASHRER